MVVSDVRSNIRKVQVPGNAVPSHLRPVHDDMSTTAILYNIAHARGNYQADKVRFLPSQEIEDLERIYHGTFGNGAQAERSQV